MSKKYFYESLKANKKDTKVRKRMCFTEEEMVNKSIRLNEQHFILTWGGVDGRITVKWNDHFLFYFF